MESPKFQGTLEKQGRMKTWAWKKYWFMLKEDQLSYVKNQEKGAFQGNIDMGQAQSARVVSGNHGFPFEIVTKSRTHLLSAPTAAQREKWIKMLHEGMKWKGSRSSVGSSLRASCNSIGEEEGYSTVLDAIGGPPSSPSSGYSSASSRASGTNPGGSRGSETDDMMYNNPSYYKPKPKDKNEKSRADDFARSSGKSIVAADGPRDSTQVVYEDIDQKRGSQHADLRRLIPLNPPSAETKAHLSQQFRESTKSDSSGIYDEVRDPLADIAISHIVKGYANIKRNQGPNPETKPVVPSQREESDEDDEDDYDEVFTPSQRGSKASSVVMRRSVQSQSISEEGLYEYTNTNSVVMRNSARSQSRNESDSDLYDSTSPPPVSGNITSPRAKKHPKSFRKSMLPSEIEDYFSFEQIPDLPHARMELTHITAFNGIRQFLANNRGPEECYASVRKKEKYGAAIKKLKDFLTLNAE